MLNLLAYWLRRFPYKNIVNCFGDIYLTRWHIVRRRTWSLMVHYFHRSDEDRALHDHPWAFVTIILWRGYNEITAQGSKRKWPGMVLFRRASWAHRVELLDGKPAVTLVLHFRRKREWGYHEKDGWIQHNRWWTKHCE